MNGKEISETKIREEEKSKTKIKRKKGE